MLEPRLHLILMHLSVITVYTLYTAWLNTWICYFSVSGLHRNRQPGTMYDHLRKPQLGSCRKCDKEPPSLFTVLHMHEATLANFCWLENHSNSGKSYYMCQLLTPLKSMQLSMSFFKILHLIIWFAIWHTNFTLPSHQSFPIFVL